MLLIQTPAFQSQILLQTGESKKGQKLTLHHWTESACHFDIIIGLSGLSSTWAAALGEKQKRRAATLEMIRKEKFELREYKAHAPWGVEPQDDLHQNRQIRITDEALARISRMAKKIHADAVRITVVFAKRLPSPDPALTWGIPNR